MSEHGSSDENRQTTDGRPRRRHRRAEPKRRLVAEARVPLRKLEPWMAQLYAAPIGAFFCPEIRALTGFGARFFSTVSKVLGDRKVLFKHKNAR